jgi:hypothetical protein
MIQNSGGETAARDGFAGASWGVVAGGSDELRGVFLMAASSCFVAANSVIESLPRSPDDRRRHLARAVHALQYWQRGNAQARASHTKTRCQVLENLGYRVDHLPRCASFDVALFRVRFTRWLGIPWGSCFASARDFSSACSLAKRMAWQRPWVRWQRH